MPVDDRILTGLALRVLAIACLTTMGALIKLAGTHGAGLPETMFFRQLFAIPVTMAWVAMGPGLATLRTSRLGGHAGRTVTGLLGMNVEGIPYAKAPWAFWGVVAFCVAVGAAVFAWFGKRHWLRR